MLHKGKLGGSAMYIANCWRKSNLDWKFDIYYVTSDDLNVVSFRIMIKYDYAVYYVALPLP